MQAPFTPKPAADSCAVLAESWARSSSDVVCGCLWYVPWRFLLVDNPKRSSTFSNAFIYGYRVILLAPDSGLWPSSFGVGNLFTQIRLWSCLRQTIKHLYRPWSGNVRLPRSTHSCLPSAVPEINSFRQTVFQARCSHTKPEQISFHGNNTTKSGSLSFLRGHKHKNISKSIHTYYFAKIIRANPSHYYYFPEITPINRPRFVIMRPK